MTTEKRSATTIIRIRPSLKAVVDRAAADEGRSSSSLWEKVMTDWLRAQGRLPKRE